MDIDRIYKSLDDISNTVNKLDNKLDKQSIRINTVENKVNQHAGIFKWGASLISGLIVGVVLWTLKIFGKSD